MTYRFLVLLLLVFGLAQGARADDPAVMSAREVAELRQLVNPEDHIAIVFIPGILGSKLAIEGKTVWGNLFSFDPELSYDPAKPASATVFDKIEVDAIVKKFGFNVYGNAITDLRDSFTDATTEVFVFPYDWRQSNMQTAKSLNELFCVIAEQNSKASGGRTSIIVAAHSMGGIVLKYWLASYWNQKADCGAFKLAEKADLERLFFLGTPHVGATKFVESLIDDYSLGNSSEWFGKLLASGLNKYGASFESVYELLPISQSERCRLSSKHGKSLPQYVYMRVDSKPKPIDVFDRRRWRDLKMPKQVPVLPGGENFYDSFLPRQLKRAEGMLCGLLDNSYGAQGGSAVFFYGRNTSPNTIDAIILARFRNAKNVEGSHEPDDVVIEERAAGYGDGTVLEDVAGAVGVVDPLQAHMSQMVHANLPDDPSFRKQLEWTILRAKETQVQKAMLRPGRQQKVTNYLKHNNVRLPDGLNQAVIARDPISGWAFSVNQNAFPAMRPPAADDGWSANNRGLALIAEQDFTSAAIVMRGAARKLMETPESDRKLVAKLLNNYGWALFRIGHFAEAAKSFKLAKQAGNARAARGLAMVARAEAELKRVGRAAILGDVL